MAIVSIRCNLTKYKKEHLANILLAMLLGNGFLKIELTRQELTHICASFGGTPSVAMERLMDLIVDTARKSGLDETWTTESPDDRTGVIWDPERVPAHLIA